MMEFQGSLDTAARHIVMISARKAGILGKYAVGTEHLLLAITASRGLAGAALRGAGMRKWKGFYYTVRLTGSGMPRRRPEHLSRHLQMVFRQAEKAAGKGKITDGQLLLALLGCTDCTALRVMACLHIDTALLEQRAGEICMQERSSKRMSSRPASLAALERYTTDLTALARCGRLDPVIGREKELFRLMAILQRRTKNNPVLLGDPGVGKTAVAEAFALAIAQGEVPEEWKDARVLSLDLAALIAGTKYRGEFEERLKSIVRELRDAPDCIAFIDEVHTLVGAGSAEGAIDASNLLKPALARGEIRLIGSTTAEEYHRTIEKDAALERRFQRIDVSEPDARQTEHILRGILGRYEQHHHVHICDNAVGAAVRIAARIRPERHFPDKAIDLLDETCAAVYLQGRTVVSARDIARIAQLFDGYTDVSRGEDAERLMQLEQQLRRTVIGQDAAVSAICRAVRRGGAGLRDCARPVASLLLTGPTGVGKTSVCTALAQALYGKDGLIRIDLSEFQQPQDTARLIGAPPGYKGYGEGGQLTERIRRRPHAVVLFDEVEKAHPDVLRLLLRLLEDGCLTDAEGRSADFRHAVIVLTSNIGSGSRGRTVGFSAEPFGQDRRIREEIQRTLQPELAARLDETVVFASLGPADCAKIAARELQLLAQRCEAQRIRLTWDAQAEQILGIADPSRGARAVRETVAQQVADPLAALILSGRAGNCVLVQAADGQVRLCTRQACAAPAGA